MLLRKDDPWIGDRSFPDVRDWHVLDRDGHSIGFVETMAVDARSGKVEAVFTGPNERFPMESIELRDHTLVIAGAVELHIRSRGEGDSPYRSLKEAFSDHYARVMSGSTLSFEEVEVAYRFGRTMANDADFAGRIFDEAEEDLMAHYAVEVGVPSWAMVREAVRFAYDLIHKLHPRRVEGLEREAHQILNPGRESIDDLLQAGLSMVTAEPD